MTWTPATDGSGVRILSSVITIFQNDNRNRVFN